MKKAPLGAKSIPIYQQKDGGTSKSNKTVYTLKYYPFTADKSMLNQNTKREGYD